MRAMTAVQGEATDEMLMVRYQRGDRGAFAELVRRYQVPVYNFAFRLLHQASMAEDVTQEVFLRIVQGPPSSNTRPLLDLALHHRAQPLRRPAAQAGLPPAPKPRPARARRGDGGSPRRARARPAPARRDGTGRDTLRGGAAHRGGGEHLPEEQREVFLLREIAGLPFREIAEVTGAGENTVKSRMRYALDRLQEALADFEEYARALR
jgi:RNA polymerase sigma-70 factor (ECF subfamily)